MLADALETAAEAAYRPVRQPIEGTMLTVIREMAEAAAARRGQPLDDVIDAVLDEAAGTVERTEQMLDVLREAHVVDAGAAGLLEFVRGAVAGYRGQAPVVTEIQVATPVSLESVHLEESRYRYCTAYLVEAAQIDTAVLDQRLNTFGDCVLVVGEAPLVKVHVHTDDPGAVLALGTEMGSVDGVEIANMHEQARARERRLTVVEGGAEEPAEVPLTAANTAIVLDSTADIPAAELPHRNWRTVPLTVSFGADEYADGVDIDVGEFYRLLRSSPHHPKTSAPSPAAYLDAFGQVSGAARVFVLPVSAQLSASSQAAVIAAAQDPRVRVLDGRTVSVGTVLLAQGIQRLVEAGSSTAEVEEWFAAARERLHLLIGVDTLEYLEKGGRIGRTRRVVGNVLGMKPLLTLRDGEVVEYGRARGRAQLWRAFERFLEDYAPAGTPARFGIAHAEAPEAAERLQQMIAERHPEAQVDRICSIGAVVGAHGGPGTFGLVVLTGA